MMFFGTQTVNEKGHLEIGGCDAVDLAARFGTPLYVIDEALIRQRCREYADALRSSYSIGESSPAYAGKAFLVSAMCRIIEQEGLWLDVSSAGEVFTAVKGGFPAGKLIFHGNNKSPNELEYAVEIGTGRIVVDNVLELTRLQELCEKMGKGADVLIRATPGIDPHTHRLIRTGQSDTKFGFNIRDGSAMTAVMRVLDSKMIRLRGFHCHIGSQLLSATAHRQAVRVMAGLMREVQDETGYRAEELNLGGGLGIRYQSESHPPSVAQFVQAVCGVLKSQLKRCRVDPPKLLMEPGRSIVGEAGTTLYTIGPVKTVPLGGSHKSRVYAAVDGGLSDNPRPQMYGSRYEATLASKADTEPTARVTIAGKHCETDVLIYDAAIALPASGDILAVQCTGAYNHSMASNYNRLPRPAVVLVCDGKADVIYRRETLEELVANDEIPARLRG